MLQSMLLYRAFIRSRPVIAPSCAVCTPHPRFKNPEGRRSSTLERGQDTKKPTKQRQNPGGRYSTNPPRFTASFSIPHKSAGNCQALRVAVLAGIVMCGAVYEMTRKVSSRCFKCYNLLNNMQKVEWNNRGFSTLHALVAAAVSFYLVMICDLFSEDAHNSIIIDRKSWLSNSMFGVSIGYFLTDLTMILLYFPSLGGKEYLLHHGVSMYAIGLALLSGKAHMYILMVLFTEVTTPFVNLRWYLDVAGQKTCNLYLYNGVALFVGWLIARIILFIYMFTHMYFHLDQARSIFTLGFYSMVAVPSVVAVMNVFWFWKILKGIVKTFSRRKHSHSENGKTD